MATTNVKKKKHIPIEELDKHFYIDGSTLKWKQGGGNRRNKVRAGNITVSGYYELSLNKVRYYAHRIAFALYYRRWPKGIIDHIDGIKTNNNPLNLRDVTDSENNQNQKKNKLNTSGIVGVSRHYGGWSAEIRKQKIRYRKWFKNKKEAEIWRTTMKSKLHIGTK